MALSGTLHTAPEAVKAAARQGVHLIGGRTVSRELGLLAPRGAEPAESGWRARQIVRQRDRVRDQSGTRLPVDTYENLLSSGRLSRGKAWLAGTLDVEPILSLDHGRKVIPVGRVRSRELVVARMLAHLERLLTPRPKPVRSGVVHADPPDVADRVRAALLAASRPGNGFVALATGVVGPHTGGDAGAIFYQVEDGTPIRADT